tara:strand:+ start:427 stop:600 length:174 start_codon:yes stop_codon:yes gene_type:complete
MKNIEDLTRDNEKLINEIASLKLELSNHKIVVDFIIRKLSDNLMELLDIELSNDEEE